MGGVKVPFVSNDKSLVERAAHLTCNKGH